MFTPDDARAVLAALTGLDSRFIVADPGTAAVRAEMWARTLGAEPACPLGFALDYIDHAYRSHRREPVQVGDIRSAWVAHEERWRLARERTTVKPARRGAMPGYLREQMLRDIERSKAEHLRREAELRDRRVRDSIEKASA